MCVQVVPIIQASLTGVTAATAVIAASIGFKNWGIARRIRKSAFLSAYLNEYRDASMGRAVRELWKLWEDSHFDRNELIAKYIDMARKDEKEWHFHFDIRRKVSAFYQEMGFLAEEDPDIMEMLMKVWGAGDLRIIKEVLLPIEMEAIRQLRDERPPDDGKPINTDDTWPHSFVAMANLYNEALKRESGKKGK